MSVINKVLKDLDRRGRKPFDAADSSSAVAADNGRPKRWLWWVSAIIISVIVALWGYQWLTTESAGEPAAELVQESIPEPIKPYRPQSAQQQAQPEPVKTSTTGPAVEMTEQPLQLPPPLELSNEPDSGPAQASPESEANDVADAKADEPQQSEPVFVKQPVNLSPQQVAAQHAEKADNAQQQGRLSDAESHWQNAVMVLPTNLDYRQKLAALQYGRGQISQALVTLNDGLKRQPDAHSLRLLSAKILQKEGQHQAALLLLGKAAPRVSDNLEYYQLQAQLAQQLEQYELAAESYGSLAQAQPANGRWYLGQAIALEQIDPATAITAYERALEHLSHQPSVEFVQTRLQQLGSSPEAP